MDVDILLSNTTKQQNYVRQKDQGLATRDFVKDGNKTHILDFRPIETSSLKGILFLHDKTSTQSCSTQLNASKIYYIARFIQANQDCYPSRKRINACICGIVAKRGNDIVEINDVLTERMYSSLSKYKQLNDGTTFTLVFGGRKFYHADDTTLSVCSKQSISEVFKVFDLYSRATGAKINRQKSEILCVGKGDLSPVEKQEYGLQVCDNNVQLLGVYVGKNRNICDDLNWKEKISKLKSLLNIWLQRQLTLQGRVVVVNTLMMSRFWYTLFVSSIPEWAYNEIKILCVNFVWNKRSHLVNYNVIINPKCNGGLQLVDMKCKIHAFRLKFLGRLINDEYDVLWKHTFKYFVSKIYNMNLGLEVLFIQVPHCELKCLPIVYIEMLEAWYILRQKSELKLSVENIYDQPLFRNPEIVLKDKSILWYDFINAGIITLKDICYEVKTGFLPDCAIVEMIQNVFENANVKNVIDRYHCLICAIPDDWKQTVQSELHHRNTKRTIDISVIINHVPFELPLCTVNKLYNCLLDDICKDPCGVEMWKTLFNIDDNDFRIMWCNVNLFWKPAKFIELDYKILHNCIFTKSKFKRIGWSDDDLCDVCGSEIEDLYICL
ncbi:unnamed protein product [Mytilus edulis]|uniref:Reverse transcriptase domain-containing protein n=1 Tax=Mytilus edulis TaxID=6550 RepID=A0A8S3TC39_MYTED|nr:unnamed protein product [Mytilus edulis]